jgi:hypothetical protein
MNIVGRELFLWDSRTSSVDNSTNERIEFLQNFGDVFVDRVEQIDDVNVEGFDSNASLGDLFANAYISPGVTVWHTDQVCNVVTWLDQAIFRSTVDGLEYGLEAVVGDLPFERAPLCAHPKQAESPVFVFAAELPESGEWIGFGMLAAHKGLVVTDDTEVRTTDARNLLLGDALPVVRVLFIVGDRELSLRNGLSRDGLRLRADFHEGVGGIVERASETVEGISEVQGNIFGDRLVRGCARTEDSETTTGVADRLERIAKSERGNRVACKKVVLGVEAEGVRFTVGDRLLQVLRVFAGPAVFCPRVS